MSLVELNRNNISRYVLWMSPILFGIVLRILVAYYNPHALVWDELAYQDLASRLVRGESYGIPFWPPGWPLVLHFVYRFFGIDSANGVWFNTIISIAIIFLTGLIGTHLFGRSVAYIAMVIMSLLPSYIFASIVLLYDIWFQFLLIVGLWVSLKSSWNIPRACVIICISILITLLRPFWLMLPIFLWAIAYLFYKTRPCPKRYLVAIQLGVVVGVLPWVLYASMEVGRFVPISLNSGMNLWIGNNPAATGAYIDPPIEFYFPENDDVARQLAIEYIKTHPVRTLQLVPMKLIYMFSQEPWSGWIFAETRFEFPAYVPEAVRWLMTIPYWLLLICSAVGVLHVYRSRRFQALAPLSIIVYHLACYIPFFGGSRFRWQVQFLLILYAAFFLRSKLR